MNNYNFLNLDIVKEIVLLNKIKPEVERRKLDLNKYFEKIKEDENYEIIKKFILSLNLEMISIEEFYETMNKQFDKFIEKDIENKKKYLLLLPQKGKSNFWVSLLFIKYLIEKNYYSEIKDRLIIVKKYSKKLHIENEHLLNGTYVFLILDDASYSGSQFKNIINNNQYLLNYCDSIQIISWISQRAVDNIKKNCRLEIPIIFPEINIKELNRIEIPKINGKDLYYINFFTNRTIFEHKMADDKSIPTDFINNTPLPDGKKYSLIQPCDKKMNDNSSIDVCYSSIYKEIIFNIPEELKYIFESKDEYRMKGGYFEKYLKYKNKYIDLKKKININ